MVTESPNTNDHTFEITIFPVPRKGKSFWGSLAKESVQRWIIKAKGEEDMVDWIVAIKAKIESYIPDSPPAPLFQSSTALESKINVGMEANNETKEETSDKVSENKDLIHPEPENEEFAQLTKDVVLKQTSADTLARQETLHLVSDGR
jgi:hypothetical protein